MLKYYSVLKNKHVNSNCFICGAGLSFNKIINSENFNKIHNHVVISVNSSIISLPWNAGDRKNRYWISNDSAVRLWTYWDKVKRCKATKIIRDSWKKYYNEIPKDFLVFSPRESSKHLNYKEDRLSFVSSVPTAIDLAIQMGCKNIFLLGCDHYTVKDKSHYWQLLPKDQQPTTKGHHAPIMMQHAIFVQNMAVYNLLKDFADDRKCNIFDCSISGKIKVFKKINFESIFNEIVTTSR